MNKIIIVTGASKGIGREIAKQLAIKGNTIIANYNKSEKEILELKKELEEKNIKIEIFKADVSKREEASKLVDYAIEKYKKIDVLINNAGVWLAGDLTECNYDVISNCIDVNTKGPIYMTKAVLPSMYENKEGLIINVCSQASFDSDDFSTVYNASKWAMRGFNRSIQKDVSKKGIKVTGFYPGFMQTNIFKKAGNDYDTSTGLETEKVAKAIEFIINCDEDVIIPEFGIKDIENY